MRLTRGSGSTSRSEGRGRGHGGTAAGELAALAWFAPLSDGARRTAARHADWCEVAAGTRLQHEGARVRWLWVVAEGVVEVRRDGEVVGLVPPGHAFGEVELLLGRPSPVEVRAAGPARVVSLPAAVFHGMFGDPSFAAGVAKHVAAYAESSSGASSTATASSGPWA